MTYKPKESVPAVPPDVKTLLEHLDVYATLLGDGEQAFAYRFKPVVEGLDQFVIRIPKMPDPKNPNGEKIPRDMAADLLASTALIPAPRVVSKIHIGNRLMELNLPVTRIKKKGDLSTHAHRPAVLLFQEGINLEKIANLKEETYKQDREFRSQPGVFGGVESMIDMVNIIRNVVDEKGFNPYVRMFKKAYALGFAGLQVDIMMRNILFSKENMTLRLCDQENKFLEKPITTEKEASDAVANAGYKHFQEFDWDKKIKACGQPLPPELKQKYEESKTYMAELLSDAHRQAMIEGPERDLPDGSNLPAIPKRIEFAAVKNTRAVKLTDPPRVLVEQLRNIVKQADITR